MNVTLQRVGEGFHLHAKNQTGNTVNIDASPAIGGEGKGARPMELMLMSLGGCSSIDMLSILKKQRQKVEDLYVEIKGDRQPGVEPSLFESIHLHFVFKGEIRTDYAEKALALSLRKYCSVARILEKTATITYSYSINGETVKDPKP